MKRRTKGRKPLTSKRVRRARSAPVSGARSVDQHMDRLESLQTAGLAPGAAVRALAAETSLSLRQCWRIKAKLMERWAAERIDEAPHRYELLLRRVERFRAKCITENKHAVAAQLFVLEARLIGSTMQKEPDLSRVLAECGPRPKDPAKALVWARKVLSVQLEEVITNPALDFVTRMRIVGDLGFKISATTARTEVEAALLRLEGLLRQHKELSGAVELVDAKSITRPETARGARGRPRIVPSVPRARGPSSRLPPDDETPPDGGSGPH